MSSILFYSTRMRKLIFRNFLEFFFKPPVSRIVPKMRKKFSQSRSNMHKKTHSQKAPTRNTFVILIKNFCLCILICPWSNEKFFLSKSGTPASLCINAIQLPHELKLCIEIVYKENSPCFAPKDVFLRC